MSAVFGWCRRSVPRGARPEQEVRAAVRCFGLQPGDHLERVVRRGVAVVQRSGERHDWIAPVTLDVVVGRRVSEVGAPRPDRRAEPNSTVAAPRPHRVNRTMSRIVARQKTAPMNPSRAPAVAATATNKPPLLLPRAMSRPCRVPSCELASVPRATKSSNAGLPTFCFIAASCHSRPYSPPPRMLGDGENAAELEPRTALTGCGTVAPNGMLQPL